MNIELLDNFVFYGSALVLGVSIYLFVFPFFRFIWLNFIVCWFEKPLPYHQPGKLSRARLDSAKASKRGAFLQVTAGVKRRLLGLSGRAYAFSGAAAKVAATRPDTQQAPANRPQVKCRAPGSSRAASPHAANGSTGEADTLPATIKASLCSECGAASPPRAPEPPAARAG